MNLVHTNAYDITGGAVDRPGGRLLSVGCTLLPFVTEERPGVKLWERLHFLAFEMEDFCCSDARRNGF